MCKTNPNYVKESKDSKSSSEYRMVDMLHDEVATREQQLNLPMFWGVTWVGWSEFIKLFSMFPCFIGLRTWSHCTHAHNTRNTCMYHVCK